MPLIRPKPYLRNTWRNPLAPPQPLPPGLAEGGWLLVIEHCVGAEADGPALEDVVDGELNVLGEQVEHPAVGAFDDLAAEEEPVPEMAQLVPMSIRELLR